MGIYVIYMKMISVFIPESYLESLDVLIMDNHFPNRSEAIRVAIRELVQKEFELKKILETHEKNEII